MATCPACNAPVALDDPRAVWTRHAPFHGPCFDAVTAARPSAGGPAKGRAEVLMYAGPWPPCYDAPGGRELSRGDADRPRTKPGRKRAVRRF